MKGHIFQLLEEFLIETAGDDGYHAMLDACSFDTSVGFIRTETYLDDDLYELVAHACTHLNISGEDAQRAFGEWILPHLIAMLPDGSDHYTTPETFLEHLGDIHKIELKKLYPDAEPPAFQYQKLGANEGELTYFSKRKMFALVEGCLKGVSNYWQTGLNFEAQPDADDERVCRYRIIYSAAKVA